MYAKVMKKILNFYLNNLIEIPLIWNGGMSFHGAVIGTIIATYIFAKKNNQSTFYFSVCKSFLPYVLVRIHPF